MWIVEANDDVLKLDVVVYVAEFMQLPNTLELYRPVSTKTNLQAILQSCSKLAR